MTMLYPKEFWAIHGPGAKVYDATGRQLRSVIACNLETGEVIRMRSFRVPVPLGLPFWQQDLFSHSYLFLGIPWLRVPCDFEAGGPPCQCHGFWPAPLRVVPKRGKEWINKEMRRKVELSWELLKDVLAELADTSSTLPATTDEHGQLRDTIAARRQAGGPVPPGQPYIIGNGDPEAPP